MKENGEMEIERDREKEKENGEIEIERVKG